MTSAPHAAARTRRFLRVRAAARSSGRTAPAVLVAGLVVGILGMHALASRGTPAVPTATSSGITGSASAHAAETASGQSRIGHAHATRAKKPDATAGTNSLSGSRHDMTSMVMLCVVVLSAAALTLLALLAGRLIRPLLPAAFMSAVVRQRSLQWVRGAGPPCEWQFSVIRC